MKLLVQICFGLGCLLPGANAQGNPPTAFAAHSSSGQFAVYGGREPGAPPTRLRLGGNTNLVRLEPTLLAVSCEHVKQALLWDLGAADGWRGKVHLRLHPAKDPDEPMVVTSARFTEGWTYQVELPDAVEPAQFVRVLVHVLLLEWANRGAAERLVEVPLWLSEGLSQKMLTESRTDLVIKPPVTGLPQRNTAPVAPRTNPLARVHEQLRGQPPLTVEELSRLTEEQLLGEDGEVYRSAAQLFVHELLRLAEGRACLRSMLGALAQHPNWQAAFFQAFGVRFKQPLDLEKWWALQLVQFVGRNLAQTWPEDESWRKLDEILQTPIQFSAGGNQTPQHAVVTLQTILWEWDLARQSKTLQTKVQQLQMLRPRVAEPVTALVDDYRQTLDNCLQKMRKAGMAHSARRPRPAVGQIIVQTANALDALDARREALRASSSKAAQPQPGKDDNP